MTPTPTLKTLREASPEWTPIRQMLLAVLEDAWFCLWGKQPCSTAKGCSKEEVMAETKAWVLSREDVITDTGYSFEAVCGALGLKAGRVRRLMLTSRPSGQRSAF